MYFYHHFLFSCNLNFLGASSSNAKKEKKSDSHIIKERIENFLFYEPSLFNKDTTEKVRQKHKTSFIEPQTKKIYRQSECMRKNLNIKSHTSSKISKLHGLKDLERSLRRFHLKERKTFPKEKKFLMSCNDISRIRNKKTNKLRLKMDLESTKSTRHIVIDQEKSSDMVLYPLSKQTNMIQTPSNVDRSLGVQIRTKSNIKHTNNDLNENDTCLLNDKEINESDMNRQAYLNTIMINAHLPMKPVVDIRTNKIETLDKQSTDNPSQGCIIEREIFYGSDVDASEKSNKYDNEHSQLNTVLSQSVNYKDADMRTTEINLDGRSPSICKPPTPLHHINGKSRNNGPRNIENMACLLDTSANFQYKHTDQDKTEPQLQNSEKLDDVHKIHLQYTEKNKRHKDMEQMSHFKPVDMFWNHSSYETKVMQNSSDAKTKTIIDSKLGDGLRDFIMDREKLVFGMKSKSLPEIKNEHKEFEIQDPNKYFLTRKQEHTISTSGSSRRSLRTTDTPPKYVYYETHAPCEPNKRAKKSVTKNKSSDNRRPMSLSVHSGNLLPSILVKATSNDVHYGRCSSTTQKQRVRTRINPRKKCLDKNYERHKSPDLHDLSISSRRSDLSSSKDIYDSQECLGYLKSASDMVYKSQQADICKDIKNNRIGHDCMINEKNDNISSERQIDRGNLSVSDDLGPKCDEYILLEQHSIEFLRKNTNFKLKIFWIANRLLQGKYYCSLLTRKNCSYPMKMPRMKFTKHVLPLYALTYRKRTKPENPTKIFVSMPMYYNGICQVGNSIKFKSDLITKYSTHFVIQFELGIEKLSIVEDCRQRKFKLLTFKIRNNFIFKSFFKENFIIMHAAQFLRLELDSIDNEFICFKSSDATREKELDYILRNSKKVTNSEKNLFPTSTKPPCSHINTQKNTNLVVHKCASRIDKVGEFRQKVFTPRKKNKIPKQVQVPEEDHTTISNNCTDQSFDPSLATKKMESLETKKLNETFEVQNRSDPNLLATLVEVQYEKQGHHNDKHDKSHKFNETSPMFYIPPGNVQECTESEAFKKLTIKSPNQRTVLFRGITMPFKKYYCHSLKTAHNHGNPIDTCYTKDDKKMIGCGSFGHSYPRVAYFREFHKFQPSGYQSNMKNIEPTAMRPW